MQPGGCDIFDDLNPGERGKTPAHRLTQLGFAAVPALIEALDDKSPTRSVGYHRNFYFSHYVLTVGECSMRILSRIAGRDFDRGRSFSDVGKDGDWVKSVRFEVQNWWQSVQAKGQKAMLLEGVRSGGPDSAE